MKHLLTIIILSFLFNTNTVFAQSISNVYVFGEDGSSENEKCSVSYDSAIASIKSALRYNRIAIVTSEKSDFSMYVNVNNFEVSGRACSVAISLELYFYAPSTIPYANKRLTLKNILCNRKSSGYLEKRVMQSTVNTELKSMVDECLAKVEDLLASK